MAIKYDPEMTNYISEQEFYDMKSQLQQNNPSPQTLIFFKIEGNIRAIEFCMSLLNLLNAQGETEGCCLSLAPSFQRSSRSPLACARRARASTSESAPGSSTGPPRAHGPAPCQRPCRAAGRSCRGARRAPRPTRRRTSPSRGGPRPALGPPCRT